MTIKIRVRAFQSIADAEIEVSGLTVVTGQNNSGKSALVRAVQGAFTNPRGTRYVRHGHDHCTVDVAFADGHTLRWEKGEKVNTYTLDGKRLDKVGQAVPVEVSFLKVVPISTGGGREVWPQFAPQFTGQVFLLDQPGSVLAESIADVTRVGVLNEALRQSQSDRRTTVSELKVRQADVVRLEGQDAQFIGLEMVEVLIKDAELLNGSVTKLREQVDGTRLLRDSHKDHVALVVYLLPVRTLKIPDGLKEIRAGLTDLDDLLDLSEKMSSAELVRVELAPVSKTVLPDTTRVAKTFEALRLLLDLRGQMRPLEAIVGEAEGVRELVARDLPDVAGVQGKVEELEGSRQLLRDIVAGGKLVSDLTRELAQVTALYDEAIHEVKDILGDAGSCPICGHG